MSTKGHTSFYPTEGHITTSQEIRQHINKWGAEGVPLHYLPLYSLELNLIEILWRKIKYKWLSLSYSQLKNAVLEILADFDSKYQINFV